MRKDAQDDKTYSGGKREDGASRQEKVLREFDEKIITTIYLAEIGKVLRNNEGDTEKTISYWIQIKNTLKLHVKLN